MNDSATDRSRLLERLDKSGRLGGRSCHGAFLTGHASLDAYLDGGFQRGQLHEIYAGNVEDIASSAGFAAMLGLCGLQPGKSLLWLRTLEAIRKGGRFHPAGFAELGGNPSALLMAVAPDDKALLRSAVDALHCDGFGVVVIECWRSPAILDLTASRRLTLAADRSGLTAILLRLDAHKQPSTASTRWAVRSAPSIPLEANAPGYPTFDLTLLKRRSGPFGKSWRVEWNRDKTRFCQPADQAVSSGARTQATLSGDMVLFSGSQSVATRERAKLTA